ncbi:MAG: hypothetical protein AAGC72_18025 [Planctomycetota bacterium]
MLNNIGMPGIVTTLIIAVVLVAPYWKLWSRTGHPGWLGLLVLVPIVNVVMIYVLAFKPWPAVEGERSNAGQTS